MDGPFDVLGRLIKEPRLVAKLSPGIGSATWQQRSHGFRIARLDQLTMVRESGLAWRFADCRTGGFAMGRFKRATVSLNSNAVAIIDDVFYTAWDVLRSHNPFRELREGSELQTSIKQRMFALATEAVIDSIQLHKQALEGPLPSNQAVRPSPKLRTPIVPGRMQRVGK